PRRRIGPRIVRRSRRGQGRIPATLRRPRLRHRAGLRRPGRRILVDRHRPTAGAGPVRLPPGEDAARPTARPSRGPGPWRRSMSFLTPLYVLGALAVAAPIVFHLIRRTPRGEV